MYTAETLEKEINSTLTKPCNNTENGQFKYSPTTLHRHWKNTIAVLYGHTTKMLEKDKYRTLRIPDMNTRNGQNQHSAHTPHIH